MGGVLTHGNDCTAVVYYILFWTIAPAHSCAIGGYTCHGSNGSRTKDAPLVVFFYLLMLIISFATSQLGLERFLSISLFPMVILAMTIERMSITWEENGGQAALTQGLGSLIVACLGYLVMTNEHLEYLMFAFPEFLLVILGLCIWMGRYTGYRVSELLRFRDLNTSI